MLFCLIAGCCPLSGGANRLEGPVGLSGGCFGGVCLHMRSGSGSCVG